MDVKPSSVQVPGEQLAYARWLGALARAGLVLLTVAFVAYATGLAGAHVPLEDLPSLWTLPLDEYLARTGEPAGWGWARMLPGGEALCLVGVSVLALATLVAYARVLVSYLRSGERVQAAIAAAQVAVLLLVALGLFGGGH